MATTTLYHCSESAGLGAFVSSVVGAYAVSILSNSTFVLGTNCASEASRMNREVARHFEFELRVVPKTQTIRVSNSPRENKIGHVVIQDHKLAGLSYILTNSEHTGLDKLFRGRAGADNMRRLGCSSYNTCFVGLRDLAFSPTNRLLSAYAEWMRRKKIHSPYGVLHIRLGDGNMAVRNDTKWRWATQQRKATNFRKDPVAHLENMKKNTSVVLSDTAWVRHLAKTLGFITMDSVAVHMGMVDKESSMKDIDGLFLEWYIMLKSAACFALEPSMFSSTACRGRLEKASATAK